MTSPTARDPHVVTSTTASPDIGIALERITLEMTSSLGLGEVLAAVSEGLVDVLDAAAAGIWLLESGDGPVPLVLQASSGLTIDAGRAIPTRIDRIARTGDHFCTNELPTDGSVGPPAWLLENGLRALAGLPLLFRERVLGVLAIFVRRRLSQEEFERLFLFARTAAVAIENARLFSEVEDLNQRLRAENRYLQAEVDDEHNCGEIVGRTPAIRRVLEKVEQVAATDASVLIEGETGTGKELVALAIHQRSRRRDRSMVKVNCGAISAGLVESELFGHEKGAFTGALERRVGRFEVADGGTLFLDEVAELPSETQVKLLRALQEQEFERVGSSQPIRVDVRIVAAGNKDLAAEVDAGRFRADLYYRLNVFPIRVPPLRERRKDIPLIAGCVLGRLSHKVGKPVHEISAEALDALMAYDWPGNVRELLNTLERAVILARGTVIETRDLGSLGAGGPDGATAGPTAGTTLLRTLDEVNREHILAVLEHTDWVIEGPRGAAGILGLHPNTLRSRLQKLGIERPRPRY